MDYNNLQKKMKMFPKVDLHRHLEGSILPETLLEIVNKFGGELPENELDKLRPLVQIDKDVPGFQTFLEKFKVYRGFYPCGDAIAHAAYTAVRQAAEDNVKYLELRYSPSHFAGGGKFPEREVIEWIQDAIQRAAADYDIIVVPILTISRDYGFGLALSTVEMAVGLPTGYFYGLDIAGDEIHNSAKTFEKLFSMAKKGGLGLTIHAGEACGPENVLQAVNDFKADRIGHGVRSFEDESVMSLLCEKDIMLEICLTSNVHTGVVSSVKNHPVRTLMQHGVPVSLNTDDPAISAISLTSEYVAAVSHLGFTDEDLKALNRRALDYVFHPKREHLKRRLLHYWE